MPAEKSARCAHAPCVCPAVEGSRFCGPHCENAVTSGKHESGDGCGCGHPDCAPLEGVPDSAIGGG